tara:strand:+ start:2185 stop:2490 length:306 start_codon:yes stop_codon:yes gene_type:complete
MIGVVFANFVVTDIHGVGTPTPFRASINNWPIATHTRCEGESNKEGDTIYQQELTGIFESLHENSFFNNIRVNPSHILALAREDLKAFYRLSFFCGLGFLF